MDQVEVTIKVTSPNLTKYLAAKSDLENYTGETFGSNPVKTIVQQDEVNYINEVKITAEVEA
jgi:hypothetical protein